MSLKSCYSRQLLFSLVFILSHTVRFLLDLINQYYGFFYHKIHLYVKGILNQNKQIKTKCPRGLRPMLETAPLVTSFLNDPLFYSAISEVNCILAFFYSDYYDFLRFIMHSFVTHTFCRNQFFRLR